MKPSELTKIVLDYAIEKGAPFTTAQAFEEIEEAQTPAEISKVLAPLFKDSYLKRKKIDGLRYQYCIADKAPEDFDPVIVINETKYPAKQEAPAIETTPALNAASNTPATYLDTAKQIVHGDRERTYGDPGKNLRLIASYWSAHLKIPLTENDVCILMMLLKIARLNNDPEHDDSWIDIAGYVALKDKLDKQNQTDQ